jgi:hypothetical protein
MLNGDLHGYIEIFDSALTIADYTAPAVSVSGGSLLGGWRSGTQTVSLDANDNVGVKITRVYIDGALRTEESDRAGRCNYGLKVPCPTVARRSPCRPAASRTGRTRSPRRRSTRPTTRAAARAWTF